MNKNKHVPGFQFKCHRCFKRPVEIVKTNFGDMKDFESIVIDHNPSAITMRLHGHTGPNPSRIRTTMLANITAAEPWLLSTVKAFYADLLVGENVCLTFSARKAFARTLTTSVPILPCIVTSPSEDEDDHSLLDRKKYNLGYVNDEIQVQILQIACKDGIFGFADGSTDQMYSDHESGSGELVKIPYAEFSFIYTAKDASSARRVKNDLLLMPGLYGDMVI